MNQHEEIENEIWSRKFKIRQLLDILSAYPNEVWKHAVAVYYLIHGNEENFDKTFVLFLRKLLSRIVPQYVIKPGANYIKEGICSLNINL